MVAKGRLRLRLEDVAVQLQALVQRYHVLATGFSDSTYLGPRFALRIFLGSLHSLRFIGTRNCGALKVAGMLIANAIWTTAKTPTISTRRRAPPSPPCLLRWVHPGHENDFGHAHCESVSSLCRPHLSQNKITRNLGVLKIEKTVCGADHLDLFAGAQCDEYTDAVEHLCSFEPAASRDVQLPPCENLIAHNAHLAVRMPPGRHSPSGQQFRRASPQARLPPLLCLRARFSHSTRNPRRVMIIDTALSSHDTAQASPPATSATVQPSAPLFSSVHTSPSTSTSSASWEDGWSRFSTSSVTRSTLARSTTRYLNTLAPSASSPSHRRLAMTLDTFGRYTAGPRSVQLPPLVLSRKSHEANQSSEFANSKVKPASRPSP
ncbi:hypothetical protein C8R45DRAFT_1184483 [Mycena sanguinolenta]|nr:hypothetical protein C8R45DRAFT_1184483 [Mycena sanguinolenta]